IRVTDLRPSGQPWFDQVTLGVIRDMLFKLFDEDRALWPRPNQTHLAVNDVNQLRQLINPQFANPPAHAGHARILFAGPNRAVRFGVHAHRTKLDDPKRSIVYPDSLLPVEDRPAGIELDRQSRQQHQRRSQQPDDDRERHVQESARVSVGAYPARGVGEDQLSEAQPLAADLAGQPGVKNVGLLQRHAVADFQFEKQIKRQSPAPVGHRDNDPVGAIPADDRFQIGHHPDHTWINQAPPDLRRVIADESDHVIPGFAACQDLSRERYRVLPGPQNEHAFGKSRMAEQPTGKVAPTYHQRHRQRHAEQNDAPAQHHLRPDIKYQGERDTPYPKRLSQPQQQHRAAPDQTKIIKVEEIE